MRNNTAGNSRFVNRLADGKAIGSAIVGMQLSFNAGHTNDRLI